GLFGAASSASQPSTAGTGLFGAASSASQPSTAGTGLFGAAAGSSQPSTAGTGLFGAASSASQPSTAGTGLFGAKPAADGAGAHTAEKQATAKGTEAPAASAAPAEGTKATGGATGLLGSSSLFGDTKAASAASSTGATTSLFGAAAAPAAGGATGTKPAGDSASSSSVSAPFGAGLGASSTANSGSSGNAAAGGLFGAAAAGSAKAPEKLQGASGPAGATASGATTAETLPPPQQVALETLQHERVEEVLAKWEKRLQRRVRRFNEVAEEVGSVEKAMIEESKKLHALREEQIKIEKRQTYICDFIDGLERQQRDLLTLLASVEASVLRQIPQDNGDPTGAAGGDALAQRVQREWEAESGFHSSSEEELLSRRLRNIDEQLNDVGLALSEATERFQPGPLGTVAQVLGIHQAALQASWRQASELQQRMDALQRLTSDAKHGE
ncbi:nucleoporin Nsp1, partial [Toxoplasma gondii CAST]